MSTNTAILLAAQGQAIAAAAEATAAHRTACTALMQGYQHDTGRMHEYANCVGLLYPDTTDYFWLKVAVWVIVAFAAGGAFRLWNERRNSICGAEIVDAVMGGISGMLVGMLFVGLAALIAWSF